MGKNNFNYEIMKLITLLTFNDANLLANIAGLLFFSLSDINVHSEKSFSFHFCILKATKKKQSECESSLNILVHTVPETLEFFEYEHQDTLKCIGNICWGVSLGGLREHQYWVIVVMISNCDVRIPGFTRYVTIILVRWCMLCINKHHEWKFVPHPTCI